MVKNEALIEVTGWLNDVKQFDWGVALKVSVDVRKKNHQDEWETVDKTIYDVTTDEVPDVEGAKQVTVTGRITGTNTFTKRDGSTGAAVKVRATRLFLWVTRCRRRRSWSSGLQRRLVRVSLWMRTPRSNVWVSDSGRYGYPLLSACAGG
jgi:hypothetical protein